MPGNDGNSGTNPASGGRLRRIGKAFLSLTVFTVYAGVASAAVMIGVTTIQMRAAERPAVEAAPLTQVRTVGPVFQSGYDVTRSFVGRLEPARRTDLGFELSGKVSDIRVDEGDRVSKGDVIAVLDSRSLEAERRRQVANRRATESDRELAFLTLNRRQKLKDGGHVSEQSLDQARLALGRLDASLDQIDAVIEAIDINLEKSVLKAPFDGQVGERLLDEGATVSPGMAVLRLLESARPMVRIGLAPEVIDRLDGDETFEIRISGRDFKARLSGLRPDLQTRTRTIETLFELQTPDAAPSFGRLAELSVTERVKADGFWLPVDALKEGRRGLWTVLAVAEDDTSGYSVVSEAVEILHATEDRVFVRGTISEETRIISEGAHRVVVGQPVSLSRNRT